MRENMDQKNSEYGHFSHSDIKGKADHSTVSFCDKCNFVIKLSHFVSVTEVYNKVVEFSNKLVLVITCLGKIM